MRYPRNYIKTSFFHIMVQVINKEYILKNENDKIKYPNISHETLRNSVGKKEEKNE